MQKKGYINLVKGNKDKNSWKKNNKQLYCNYCKLLGHQEKDCYFLYFNKALKSQKNKDNNKVKKNINKKEKKLKENKENNKSLNNNNSKRDEREKK